MDAPSNPDELRLYFDTSAAQISSRFDSILNDACSRYGYERDRAYGRHPGWRIRQAPGRIFDISLDWDHKLPGPPLTADSIFHVNSGVVHVEGSYQFRLFRPFGLTRIRQGLLESKIETILQNILPVLSGWSSAKVLAEGWPLDTASTWTLAKVEVVGEVYKHNSGPWEGKLISEAELELALRHLT